jgi:hypothetical protein
MPYCFESFRYLDLMAVGTFGILSAQDSWWLLKINSNCFTSNPSFIKLPSPDTVSQPQVLTDYTGVYRQTSMSFHDGLNRTHAFESMDTQIEMDTFDPRMEHRFRKIEQQMPALKRRISDAEP